MDWLVDCVQEGAGDDMMLSFDTTNLAAIEVGLKKLRRMVTLTPSSTPPQPKKNDWRWCRRLPRNMAPS